MIAKKSLEVVLVVYLRIYPDIKSDNYGYMAHIRVYMVLFPDILRIYV